MTKYVPEELVCCFDVVVADTVTVVDVVCDVVDDVIVALVNLSVKVVIVSFGRKVYLV